MSLPSLTQIGCPGGLQKELANSSPSVRLADEAYITFRIGCYGLQAQEHQQDHLQLAEMDQEPKPRHPQDAEPTFTSLSSHGWGSVLAPFMSIAATIARFSRRVMANPCLRWTLSARRWQMSGVKAKMPHEQSTGALATTITLGSVECSGHRR